MRVRVRVGVRVRVRERVRVRVDELAQQLGGQVVQVLLYGAHHLRVGGRLQEREGAEGPHAAGGVGGVERVQAAGDLLA